MDSDVEDEPPPLEPVRVRRGDEVAPRAVKWDAAEDEPPPLAPYPTQWDESAFEDRRMGSNRRMGRPPVVTWETCENLAFSYSNWKEIVEAQGVVSWDAAKRALHSRWGRWWLYHLNDRLVQTAHSPKL